MSEGTLENDGGEAEGEQTQGLATGAGPTESGDEPLKNQGDPMDDVDLEPPSS